jgi:hypothetical protein
VSSRARALVGTLSLLVLALVLRVPRGDLAEWKSDEAIEWAKARAIVREGAWPRGLPTTEGPRAPAHPLYAYAAALAIDDRPESCRLEVALLWSLAAAALATLGRRELGARAALGAGLVLAVLPDLVRRGRMAWYPNLSGPVAALALVAFLATVRAPRGRAPGVLLGVSALLGLLHYSNVGVAALGVATSAWAFRKGADRRALGLGLAAAVLLATPFVAGEIGRGFADTRAALSVATHGGGRTGGGASDPERRPWAFGLELAAALDLERYARTLGPSGEAWALAQGPPHASAIALAGLLGGLALAGAVLGLLELGRAFSRRGAPGPAGATLGFLVAAWTPFAVLRLPAREHYVQSALPAVVALAGLALARAVRVRPGTRALAAALLLAVGVVGVLETRAVLATVDAGRSEPDSAYDLPFRDKRGACEIVLEQELELGRYRRFEDALILEECFRELERRDPKLAARFERVPFHEAYWELDYALPRPRVPKGRVELVAAPGPLAGEVGRSGSIAVRRLP